MLQPTANLIKDAAIELQAPPHFGGSIAVLPYGAHLTSWKTGDDYEVMFMSDGAIFKEGKAIRGGIPIIFPKFGGGVGVMPAEIENHGFARNRTWTTTGIHNGTDKSSLAFVLNGDATTSANYPHSFTGGVEFVLTDKLTINGEVINTGDTQMSFQIAFHQYLNVTDIHGVKILGLNGVTYKDSNQQMKEFVDRDAELMIKGETDRIYTDVPGDVTIVDPSGRKIIIASDMPDRVVWNPWIDKTSKLDDLTPKDAWQRFVCVETGVIKQPKTLRPNDSYRFTTTFTVY